MFSDVRQGHEVYSTVDPETNSVRQIYAIRTLFRDGPEQKTAAKIGKKIEHIKFPLNP